MPYIYIVRCEDNSLYTGIAMDLERRMWEHYYKKKAGAKYTKSHQLRSLEMVWEAESWSYAAKLEYRIKRLLKSKKEELILHPERANELPSLRQMGIRYQPHPEMTLEKCILPVEEESRHL